MAQLNDLIWWHVYPLGACGAPVHEPDTCGHDHRLTRLIPWLSYVADLGCTGIALGPVFASSTHGYDTLNHFQIDPRLGDEADLIALIEAADAHGMGILLDGVFNHVGREHQLVTSGSPAIRRHDTGHETWEGHAALAQLDHTQPQVVDLVTDAMTYWLDRGICGWRLDAAYSVPDWFWREVIGRVRARYPHAIFLGEVIHGDYGSFAEAANLDTVTHYEWWKAIWSSLAQANMWELAWALDRDAHLRAGRTLTTFVGNHDVTRIASTLGDAGAALAAGLLLTLPGMPSIYYGDEQAFRGVKGSGVRADDPLRPALPTSPQELAPHGWWLYRWHQDLIAMRRRHRWLAGASVHVLAKDCTWISYECVAADHAHRLRVDLALNPAAQIHISADDGDHLSWTA